MSLFCVIDLCTLAPVGQQAEVVGWEFILVSQHMVVRGAAGALQAGVAVEVERVLEGVLSGNKASFMFKPLR